MPQGPPQEDFTALAAILNHFNLVQFVGYTLGVTNKQTRVHLDPNIHHLAGYPLGLPQGPLGLPGI